MASIEPYQTKAGRRWKVHYRKPNRKPTTKRGFTTKRDASLFAATVETRKAEGLYVDPTRSNVPLEQLWDPWLGTVKGADSTREVYERAWLLHVKPEFGSAPVGSITYEWVRDWVSDMKLRLGESGASSIRRNYRILRSVMDEAVREKRIPRNPAGDVSNLPSVRSRKNVYLTYQQVESGARHSGKYALAFYLAVYVGLRRGEVRGVDALEDVDLEKRRIWVRRSINPSGIAGPPKNKKAREVGYPAFLDEMMRAAVDAAARGESTRLVPSLPDPRKAGWWGTMKKNAGLPEALTFHDLRHSAASFAISEGAHVKVVQNMLGHASAKTTLDTYADLWEQDINVVADLIHERREVALAA